jgi:hypothetical protein
MNGEGEKRNSNYVKTKQHDINDRRKNLSENSLMGIETHSESLNINFLRQRGGSES